MIALTNDQRPSLLSERYTVRIYRMINDGFEAQKYIKYINPNEYASKVWCLKSASFYFWMFVYGMGQNHKKQTSRQSIRVKKVCGNLRLFVHFMEISENNGWLTLYKRPKFENRFYCF